MPLKKSVRSKTSAGAKKSSRVKRKSSTLGAGVIVMALVCVAAVAMLMAAREASDVPEITTAAAETQMAADRTGAKKVAASRTSAAVPTAMPTTGVVAADDPDMESAPESPAKKATPVTIAGCLERGNGSFRLTDTAGSDAPKSRSWKSGFLKKGSASVDLVESGNGLKLRDHVGKRVSVTGTLTDRQMRVQSMRRLAPSCS
jgi:hypothetical protein